MRKIIWLLISGFVLGSGCREKPLPEEVIGNPDFFISATIENNPVDIQAGIDNYYMSTGFSKDQLDMYSFRATFTRLNCPQCPGELEVVIRDTKVRTQEKP
ncbi:MAG: hypothetical protein R3C61_00995 [Bacteroidia bacterium]